MSKKASKNGIGDKAGAAASYLLRLVFVPKCVICGELLEKEGELCPDCLSLWESARREKCPVCRKSARACTCRAFSLFDTDEINERSQISLVFYKGYGDESRTLAESAVSKLIWTLKTSSDRSAVRFTARELSGDILRHFAKSREPLDKWRLTYPPRTASRRREYGFDQGRDLAGMISRYTGIPVEKCFINKGTLTQKKLNSLERKRNAAQSYRLRDGVSPKGIKYIIVDDVITTGATVNACALLLKDAGAQCVFPVSAARTKRRKRNVRRPAKDPWFKFSPKA